MAEKVMMNEFLNILYSRYSDLVTASHVLTEMQFEAFDEREEILPQFEKISRDVGSGRYSLYTYIAIYTVKKGSYEPEVFLYMRPGHANFNSTSNFASGNTCMTLCIFARKKVQACMYGSTRYGR